MSRLVFLIVFALGFSISAAARAHDTRPLYVEIIELPDGVVRVSWTTPPSEPVEQSPTVALMGCLAAAASGPPSAPTTGRQGLALYRCAEEFDGATLAIDYPLYNPSLSTLVRIEFLTGETRAAILPPDIKSWLIPTPETFESVARSYFRIGVDHIWGGVDHLLFLAGLLFIARTPRRVLVTITGFTLAHSLTIFLVALNVVRVSVPAVESVIALSIVFLAAEIARGNKETLAWRRPIVVAALFGLVHGAGFASALAEIGLPQTEKVGALIFFNLGVEAGQIAVVAGVFAAAFALFRLTKLHPAIIDAAPFRPAFSYALGLVAAFWFAERVAGALAPTL